MPSIRLRRHATEPLRPILAGTSQRSSGTRPRLPPAARPLRGDTCPRFVSVGTPRSRFGPYSPEHPSIPRERDPPGYPRQPAPCGETHALDSSPSARHGAASAHTHRNIPAFPGNETPPAAPGSPPPAGRHMPSIRLHRHATEPLRPILTGTSQHSPGTRPPRLPPAARPPCGETHGRLPRVSASLR